MEPLIPKLEKEEKAEEDEQNRILEEQEEREQQQRVLEEIKAAQQLNGPCPSRPEEELKQIARDLQAGHIFTDKHMSEYDQKNLGMVFMVLMFMDPRDFYIPETIGMIYEHMSQAMPRSINGMPMFTSLHYLNVEDTKYVLNKAKEIDEMLKNI
jgi:hypothetical protein